MIIYPLAEKKIILGVDPGLTITGYSLIAKQGSSINLLDYGALSLASNKQRTLIERVGMFYDFFTKKICEHQVTIITLETPFLGKNVQSFLKLGYLRGILYSLAYQHKLEVKEFSPREIKQVVTGYGGASKEQVAAMIYRLLPGLASKTVKTQDVSDAIAVGLTGAWNRPLSRV